MEINQITEKIIGSALKCIKDLDRVYLSLLMKSVYLMRYKAVQQLTLWFSLNTL